MKTYFRILKYARPFGWLAPMYILCILLYVIFAVLNIASLQPILDVIFGEVDKMTISQPILSKDLDYLRDFFNYKLIQEVQLNGKSSGIVFIIKLLMVSVILSNLFRYLASLIIAKIKVQLITNFRKDFIDSILHFDLRYFSDKNRGDLMSRGSSDLMMVENSVADTLKVLVKDPLYILALFITLFNYSSELTLYSMIVLPVAGFIISTLSGSLKRTSRKAQGSIGMIISLIDEILYGIKVVKAFVSEKKISKRFMDRVHLYGNQVIKIALKQNLAQPVSEIFGVAASCIVIYFGASIVFNGDMSSSALMTFLVMFTQLLTPAKAISNRLRRRSERNSLRRKDF